MKEKIYLTFIVMLMFALTTVGQIVPPPMPPPPPPGLSIDGGLVFLIVLGILYGIKKVKNSLTY